MFLDLIEVLRGFNLVTCLFNVGPASFNIEGCVERKLFMHHPKRMVSPHVVKAICSELTCA